MDGGLALSWRAAEDPAHRLGQISAHVQQPRAALAAVLAPVNLLEVDLLQSGCSQATDWLQSVARWNYAQKGCHKVLR